MNRVVRLVFVLVLTVTAVTGAYQQAYGGPGLTPAAIEPGDGGPQLTVGLIVIAPGDGGHVYAGDDDGAPAPVRYEAVAGEPQPPGLDHLCLVSGSSFADAVFGWWYTIYAYDAVTGALLSAHPECVPFPDPDTGAPPPPPELPVPPSITEIWRSVPIPAPPVGTDPVGEGFVGLETRAWSGGPREVAVAVDLRGFTVTGVARLVEYRFDLGDGAVVAAAGPGDASHPAIRHTYRDKGARELRVGSVWRATLTLDGPGLDRPVDFDGGTAILTVLHPYPVVEVRSVLLP